MSPHVEKAVHNVSATAFLLLCVVCAGRAFGATWERSGYAAGAVWCLLLFVGNMIAPLSAKGGDVGR